jgi:hypothetical protein
MRASGEGFEAARREFIESAARPDTAGLTLGHLLVVRGLGGAVNERPKTLDLDRAVRRRFGRWPRSGRAAHDVAA